MSKISILLARLHVPILVVCIITFSVIVFSSAWAADVDQNGLTEYNEQILADRFKPSFILSTGRVCEPEPVEIMTRQGSYLDMEDVWMNSVDITSGAPTEAYFRYANWWNLEEIWRWELEEWPDPDDPDFPASLYGEVVRWVTGILSRVNFCFEYGDENNQTPSDWRSDYLNSAAPTGGDNYPPTVYPHFFFDGTHWVIQYWIFYPYNAWVNDHEGDWEHINVITDYQPGMDPNEAQLLTVDYRFHNKYLNAIGQQQAYILDETHPVIFVGGYEYWRCADRSRGGSASGGSYPAPGLWYEVGPAVATCPTANDRVYLGGKYIPYDKVNAVVWPQIVRWFSDDTQGVGVDYFRYHPEKAWMLAKMRFGHYLTDSAPFIWHTPPIPDTYDAYFSPLNPPYQEAWEKRNPGGDWHYYSHTNTPLHSAPKAIIYTLKGFPGPLNELDAENGELTPINRDYYQFAPDNTYPHELTFTAPEFVVSLGVAYVFDQWSDGSQERAHVATLTESSTMMDHIYAEYTEVTGHVSAYVDRWNGSRIPMLDESDAASLCPEGDRDKLIIELDYSAHPIPEFTAATSIRIGAPINGNIHIWDDVMTAEWDLSAENGWKTEIVLEAASGCGSDFVPVLISDEVGGEIELAQVLVHLRSFDFDGDGSVAIEDYGTFGQSYGSCGVFECADFVPNGCVDAPDHSAFGQHYGHSYVGNKSQAVLTPLPDSAIASAKLMPCYPNPFNPMTNIEFSLSKSGAVFLGIFDVQGRLVKTIVDESRSDGVHRVTWDGTDRDGSKVASGMYFYRMNALGESYTNSMILMK